ncbi:conserved hypothetical protein [Verticillium alfalfae VaMs.102]|uniref:Deacetylase sirtuin-type domain-containing protein n=1 Tax=Verticillium alfalfae (strain VaMs.102 / ATCC MYA-4576 / FGSC 10136) TaxID=526221 RepID=C9SJH2_VERA1|nr:conserved hypothetical protein [Verticillium alfalfae VaMs.102]EEY18334.1 conserved hypothetical protein [Verticillium alfalfae VaMs.102]
MPSEPFTAESEAMESVASAPEWCSTTNTTRMRRQSATFRVLILKSRPDAVIVVGTSLKIPGVRRLVKELCQATRNKRGGFTAWINLDSEPQHNDFKDCWDLVVRGKSDDVAHFAQLPPYDVPSAEPSDILNEEDNKIREQWLQRDKVEVQLSQSSYNTSLPKPEF